MEQGTTFWLATTSQASELVSAVTTCADSDQLKKAGDLVSMFNQPAVVNFASVLTGGNGAFDSSRTIRILPTERESALNEIGIVQKRPSTQYSINSLPSVSAAVASSALLQPPTSTMVVNSLNNVAALPMCAYPLQLPSDTIQISKNFIQHAAAASGLPSSNSASLPTARDIQNTSLNGDNVPTYVGAAADSIAPNSESSPASLQPEASSAYQCSDCNKTFENTGQLRYHTFVAHGELQARPHKCSACPESFLMDHHLNDHIRAIHLPVDQGGGPPFTCSECSTSFNDGGHLNFHLYMAHTIQGSKAKQLRYPCPECGKNFNKSSLLDEHIRTSHTIEDSSEPDMKQTKISLVQGPNLHKCFDCGKAFKTYPYLKQHMMSVHDKPLKCTICNRGFGRKSDLKRHMRGVHLKKRPYVCTKCGWTFSEIGNLKHHLQAVHQREKNFKCTYCHKTFSLLSYLKTHLSRMHKTSSNNTRVLKAQDQIKEVQMAVTTALEVPQLPIVRLSSASTVTTPISTITLQAFKSVVTNSQMLHCYECGQVCESSESLQNHVISTHPQPFWCTVCGEGFGDSTHLQVHLQLRHLAHGQNRVPATSAQSLDVSPTDIGEFAIEIPRALAEGQAVVAVPSDVPKTVFSALQTVPSMHGVEQTVSLSGSANKCLMCGAILNEHPEAHVCWKKINTSNIFGENEIFLKEDRPHSCSVCGKGFKTTTHLKQHVRCVHSKQRPHKCPHCDKCFARMSDKNRHVKGVHQRIKNVKNSIFVTLKCSECGAMYAETSQLKKHIYTHHLRGKPSYKCADCQEGFSDDASFQNHICHEVDKPHVCTICAKRFHMVQQLRRHIRAAHGKHSEDLQTHKCFQCERVFGRPVDLERHIQAVHLKEKPHKCTLCGKSFGLQGNLNKHVRAVHLLEKPHQCVECGKKFAHIGVLKRHLRDIHFYDKKASVKEKLALLQVKNGRQLMCNVTNLQNCDLNEAEQADTATQTTLNHVRHGRPQPSQPQTEQDSQHAMTDRHVDLPLIETISQQQLEEVAMQVHVQDHVGNV